MKEKMTNENLVKNCNQPQNEELMNDIKIIDMYLIKGLSDWIWDELKYFQKESEECTDIMCELIMGDEYYEKSPLIQYVKGIQI